MSFNNICFILARPQLGENIGFVARALKNFNLTNLRIVNPRCNWPNQEALVTSVGAKNIFLIKNGLNNTPIIIKKYAKIFIINLVFIKCFLMKYVNYINRCNKYNVTI